MPPRRTANQRCVAEEDELDRRIEQIIDIRLVVALERRLDVVVDRLGEKMGALMETRQEFDPRCGRVPNSTANLEEIEYDSNSEGDATLFSEEDPPDDAFFVAGGDGEAEYDEDGNPFHSDRVSKLSDNSFTRQVKRRNQDLPMRSFSFMPAYHIEDISYDEADSVFDIYPEEVIEFVFDDQGKPTFVANKFVLKDIGGDKLFHYCAQIGDILDEEIFNAKKDAWMLTVSISEVIQLPKLVEVHVTRSRK
ncbi:hypothetical protein CDL15_Pgr020819 [Punica granatum]|uniref:Uncharacterized protein n=1 Tax=Punica granatum TaxID=22663 RepID=A0A218XUN4_PUNGR|nr:hypothetical protein CDL15_Pgr020819 [Punica granatum]